MEALKKALANLIKIKSLVTVAVITVFSVLSLKGVIEADSVMNVVLMVVAFYFGTQHEKKGGASNGT
jgi:uncharacterized protein (DUF486 family)